MPSSPVPFAARLTRRHLSLILALFLGSRVIVVLSALIFWHHLPHAPVKPGDAGLPAHHRLADLFFRADAGHYTELAEHGYHLYEPDPTTGLVPSNAVFYPLYPSLTRLARELRLAPDTVLAGHLVSNVCLLAAALLLWKLAALELRSTVGADWTVAFALCCPGGAWSSMVFAEGLFLLALTGYLLTVRRGQWVRAGVVGVLLALTRTVGLLAVTFTAWELLQEWRRGQRAGKGVLEVFTPAGWTLRLFALAGPVLGYLSVKLYFWYHFGDWNAQQHAFEAGWPVNAHLSAPWTAIAREWAPMHVSKRIIIYGLLAAALASLPLVHRATGRWSYFWMSLTMLTIYVTATYHSPMARYLSVMVPLHLTLGWMATRAGKLFATGLLLASLLLMTLLTGLMTNGYVFY